LLASGLKNTLPLSVKSIKGLEGAIWEADFDEILEKCQGRKETAAAGRAE